MKSLLKINTIIPSKNQTQIQFSVIHSDPEQPVSADSVILIIPGQNTYFDPTKTYAFDISLYEGEAGDATPAPADAPTEELTPSTNIENPNQMSIFTKIADFFVNLFNSLKSEYEKLDPVIKTDIANSINAVNVIKANLTTSPTDLFQLLANKIGEFATGKLKTVLFNVATDLGIAVAPDADENTILAAIQAYLKERAGNALSDALHGFAKYLVTNLNPEDITRQEAGPLLQWVYDHIPTEVI